MSLLSDLETDWANVVATVEGWFTALEPAAEQELALIWNDVTTWASTEAGVVLTDLQAAMPAFVSGLEAYALELITQIEAYFPVIATLAAKKDAAPAPVVPVMPTTLATDVKQAWIAAGLWQGAATGKVKCGTWNVPLSDKTCHSVTARVTTKYLATK